MSSATTSGSEDLTGEDRSRLGRRARLLAAASVGYNVVEAVIAITAGVVAGIGRAGGFRAGASVIEVSSGLIIIWQFPIGGRRPGSAVRCG